MGVMHKIESGIPLKSWKPRQRYPFPRMEVGDSFLLKSEDNLASVRSAACLYGKRHSTKFAVRCDDPVKDTHRCWRIA